MFLFFRLNFLLLAENKTAAFLAIVIFYDNDCFVLAYLRTFRNRFFIRKIHICGFSAIRAISLIHFRLLLNFKRKNIFDFRAD